MSALEERVCKAEGAGDKPGSEVERARIAKLSETMERWDSVGDSRVCVCSLSLERALLCLSAGWVDGWEYVDACARVRTCSCAQY